MKKAILLLLIACSLAFAGQGMGPGPGVKSYSGGGTTFTDIGIDFTTTPTFATHAAPNVAYTAGSDATNVANVDYSSIVGYGWEAITFLVATRDRDNSGDQRIAGMHFLTGDDGTQTATFRVNVVAGGYTICVALGDYSFTHGDMHATVYDNVTSRFTITGNTATNNFIDTNGTTHASPWVPSWPGSTAQCQTAVSLASGIFRIILDEAGNVTPGATTTVLSHIRLIKTS